MGWVTVNRYRSPALVRNTNKKRLVQTGPAAISLWQRMNGTNVQIWSGIEFRHLIPKKCGLAFCILLESPNGIRTSPLVVAKSQYHLLTLDGVLSVNALSSTVTDVTPLSGKVKRGGGWLPLGWTLSRLLSRLRPCQSVRSGRRLKLPLQILPPPCRYGLRVPRQRGPFRSGRHRLGRSLRWLDRRCRSCPCTR
jgi:hypothetical protein